MRHECRARYQIGKLADFSADGGSGSFFTAASTIRAVTLRPAAVLTASSHADYSCCAAAGKGQSEDGPVIHNPVFARNLRGSG